LTTITTIITCYREGELIYKALDSLFNQNDTDFNIILVNGCSPDETTNRVCKEIEKSKKVLVIWNEVNLGMGISRNSAFEKLTTDVAVFLDADDTLPPNTIANIRSSFNAHPDADFVFGNYKLCDLEQNIEKTVDCSVISDINGSLSPSLLANNWKLLGSSPCKKSLWTKIGGYSLEFSNTANDVDFWQRAILAGAKGYFVNANIYNWNRSITGLNSAPAFLTALEICNYRNIDFVIKYSDIYKEGFNIALTHKDYQKIKEWAKYEITNRNNQTVLAITFNLCPIIFVPFLCDGYRILKKIFKN
jgi:glycosyltransferase involved in cell wall biosynthesis